MFFGDVLAKTKAIKTVAKLRSLSSHQITIDSTTKPKQ